MLRVGLIGNGGIAGNHKGAYRALPSVKLEAICDVHAEQLLQTEGVRTYTDYLQMLEQEQGRLDFVDLCVPTALHAEISIKAMEMGYHVLCEKPMARTLEQAQAMLDASGRTGKTLMIAHCCRFMAEAELIGELIKSGELGKVRSAMFCRTGGEPGPMGRDNWYYNGRLSGGGLLDQHIHDTDLLCSLFGMPKTVSAVGLQGILTEGCYDALSTNYAYEDGSFVHVSWDWTTMYDKFNTRTMRVNFEKGYLYADRFTGRDALMIVREDGTVTDLTEKIREISFFRKEIEYFAQCLETGAPVDRCPPEEAYDALRLVLAEKESADKGGIPVALS